MKQNSTLKIRFLGGVGEIGKNMTALEYGKDIIVIDAGVTFPSQDMPGIDLVIPDISYLTANKDRVRAIILTHGHEDHIGAISYILKDINVPIYGTKMSLALVETKLAEFKITKKMLKRVNPRDRINLGAFSVEFINVNHSIAGACALAITTPVGVVVHSGDFKIDMTPINGNMMDFTRLSEIGKKGVMLLMCESTNVERTGYAMSEHVVGQTLERLFLANVKRRIIIATFSSNIYRLQQIFNIAAQNKRKVAISGRSMLNVVDAAVKIGELNIPQGILIDIEKIKNVPDKDLVVISTGSQGEPMSVLTRMASDSYPQLTITPNDTIIISASPIPGNEKSIYDVINNLYRKGAEVVYESIENIHVSGHACQEELKIFHSLIKPKFFIPIHGEYRHLKKHTLLAKELGMKDYQMIIPDIGDTVILNGKTMRFGDKVPAGSRYVDGLQIDDSNIYVRDRLHLAEEGLIIALCCVSSLSGELLKAPDIISKGVVLSDAQTEAIRDIVSKTLSGFDLKRIGDKREVKNKIRSAIRTFVIKKTKNNPMILPVITQV
ncbi:MAG: ribonuclease J [Clostridia bacterium]|nr:ribonuclease J [Clostridia bacterium]MBR6687733.1 ribonuclease J [Clostridia bacterium]